VTDNDTCTASVQTLANSYFVDGTGGYQRDSQDGYCVRSTDNDYDNSNLTTMFSEGASIAECAAACDADETCVAFDHGPDGYCYAYKMDPLADYVGSGDEDWECYHKIVIPTFCNSESVTQSIEVIN
jgi:hypothetical protein